MNDRTILQMIQSEIERVALKHGDLEKVLRRGRRRRLALRIGRLSVTAAAAVVTIGVAAVLRPTPAPVATGGEIDLELVAGFSIPVVDNPITSHDALIYEALPGPGPRFDVENLGTEIVIATGPPDRFVMPISDNPRNALQADRVVYLGDLNGAQLALHAFNGKLCVYLGNGTEVSGGGTCELVEGLAGGNYRDPPIGEWLVWTDLPESASVVLAKTSEGRSYWQRPIGRTVFFNLSGGRNVVPASMSAIDMDGNEVASTRGTLFDLTE